MRWAETKAFKFKSLGALKERGLLQCDESPAAHRRG